MDRIWQNKRTMKSRKKTDELLEELKQHTKVVEREDVGRLVAEAMLLGARFLGKVMTGRAMRQARAPNATMPSHQAPSHEGL